MAPQPLAISRLVARYTSLVQGFSRSRAHSVRKIWVDSIVLQIEETITLFRIVSNRIIMPQVYNYYSTRTVSTKPSIDKKRGVHRICAPLRTQGVQVHKSVMDRSFCYRTRVFCYFFGQCKKVNRCFIYFRRQIKY